MAGPIREFAVRLSHCDGLSCEVCWANDKMVMTAIQANEWVAKGKEHSGCRCSVRYFTADELYEFLENSYNQQACYGMPWPGIKKKVQK